MRKVRARFPVLGWLGESFAKGRGGGDGKGRRTREASSPSSGNGGGRSGRGVLAEGGGTGERVVVPVVERLSDGKLERFGGLEEVPAVGDEDGFGDGGELGDEDEGGDGDIDGEEWEEYPFARKSKKKKR